MISFKLRCGGGHEFEGWFRSSDDFERQECDGLLSCPICSDENVEKAMMAPAIARRGGIEEMREESKPPKQAPSDMPVPTPEMMARMIASMRAIKAHVETNFENVGREFPEEARKIHYGESEHRDIYGKANFDEARELIEEGIEIVPLANVPDLDS